MNHDPINDPIRQPPGDKPTQPCDRVVTGLWAAAMLAAIAFMWAVAAAVALHAPDWLDLAVMLFIVCVGCVALACVRSRRDRRGGGSGG